MKYARILLAALVLVTAANAEATMDLGLGAFSNESGAILVAVDAAMVNQARARVPPSPKDSSSG